MFLTNQNAEIVACILLTAILHLSARPESSLSVKTVGKKILCA